MRKIISIILASCMILAMAACSSNKVNIGELKKINGTMLEVKVVPSGEMTREQFEAGSKTLSVSYSGAAFNPNPVDDNGVMMSDEDFLTIYNFCIDCYKNGKYKDYSEDACDGTRYSFIYYDENGTRNELYHGYIYGNEEMCKIVDIISSYSVD